MLNHEKQLQFCKARRGAIARGAEAGPLFEIPFRERIGRAKSVPDEEYPAVFLTMAGELEAQIEAVLAQGGAGE